MKTIGQYTEEFYQYASEDKRYEGKSNEEIALDITNEITSAYNIYNRQLDYTAYLVPATEAMLKTLGYIQHELENGAKMKSKAVFNSKFRDHLGLALQEKTKYTMYECLYRYQHSICSLIVNGDKGKLDLMITGALTWIARMFVIAYEYEPRADAIELFVDSNLKYMGRWR